MAKGPSQILPYCAVVPALGVPAWQLDGAFLGATQGRALRTSAVISTAAYLGLDLLLAPRLGNAGPDRIPIDVPMYLARALALGAHWPGLLRCVESAEH